VKLFLTLIFLFSIKIQGLAQEGSLSVPTQSDSIYKKALVKSRELEYTGRWPGQSKEILYFDREGKKIRSDEYTSDNPELVRYRLTYIYKDSGLLDSTVRKDLTNSYGLKISIESEATNEIISKFEYDSSNKLKRRFSKDSLGVVYGESLYYKNKIVTKSYDTDKKLRTEDIDSLQKDGLVKKSITTFFTSRGKKEFSAIEKNFFEYDKVGRVIKVYSVSTGYATGVKHKSIYHYTYNKMGLLINVSIKQPFKSEVKFKYEFWDAENKSSSSY
jgi:hypothetical protein